MRELLKMIFESALAAGIAQGLAAQLISGFLAKLSFSVQQEYTTEKIDALIIEWSAELQRLSDERNKRLPGDTTADDAENQGENG